MKPRPTGGSTHWPRADRCRCRLLRPSSRHASAWWPTASVCRGWSLSSISKGPSDAVHGLAQGRQEYRGGCSAEHGIARRDGQVQRGVRNAGVMLAGEGLQPSSKGARIKFSGGRRTVTTGPFPERELIAGFWMFQVNSIEEAIEWVKRCPDPLPGGEAEIEIRQVFEASDFETMTPELREQEERLRATVESRRSTS